MTPLVTLVYVTVFLAILSLTQTATTGLCIKPQVVPH